MKTLVKWVGGKSKELPIIRENIPTSFDNYYEPFVGGGAVLFDLLNRGIQGQVNDTHTDLITFYNMVKSGDGQFFHYLDQMNKARNDLISDPESYMISHNVYEEHRNALYMNDNITTIALSALYYTARDIYNNKSFDDSLRSAMFFYIRCFCFSGMIRTNDKGEFNVPYGGTSYNKRKFQSDIEYLREIRRFGKLNKIKFHNLDYRQFLKRVKPTPNDFVFIDPPYNRTFNSYGKNRFGDLEQVRLAEVLGDANYRWMLIVNNNAQMRALYEPFYAVKSYSYRYDVNFKNRGDYQNTNHLMVTNYDR